MSVLAYDNEGCHDYQCLVTVSCKTPNTALKINEFTKNGTALKITAGQWPLTIGIAFVTIEKLPSMITMTTNT